MEQALVIAVGMALGTWMGGGLGATIMPLLGHDDKGAQVLPPFAIDVGWGNLLVTYFAMALIFTAIILGVIWFIRRMSLSNVLRLGGRIGESLYVRFDLLDLDSMPTLVFASQSHTPQGDDNEGQSDERGNLDPQEPARGRGRS